MADANSVSSGLAVLGGSGWVPTNDPRYGGASVLWRSTWANRPVAGQIADGQPLLVADVGPTPGTPFMWDATNARWRPQTGVALLAMSGTPTILPSSGVSNATGQITLTTALPYQPAGTVGLYLPAGVVVGDAVGGVKQVIFSSTSVCQIVGAPATANGAYAQTTGADITLVSINVPASSMGPNGGLRIANAVSQPNNANNKVYSMKLAGQSVALDIIAAQNISRLQGVIKNRGSSGQQVSSRSALSENGTGGLGVKGGGDLLVRTAIDMTQAQVLTLTVQLAVATDFAIIDDYLVELLG